MWFITLTRRWPGISCPRFTAAAKRRFCAATRAMSTARMGKFSGIIFCAAKTRCHIRSGLSGEIGACRAHGALGLGYFLRCSLSDWALYAAKTAKRGGLVCRGGDFCTLYLFCALGGLGRGGVGGAEGLAFACAWAGVLGLCLGWR